MRNTEKLFLPPFRDYTSIMKHRHLSHGGTSLPAIDDIISRGRWEDWVDLRRAVLSAPSLLRDVVRVCQPYIDDPYAQRYHFWMHYANEHLSAT